MKIFLFIISLALFISCNQRDQVPEDIIPPDKMTSILIDIYISEAKVKSQPVRSDSADKLFRIFEQNVYERHNIDSTTYIKSYEYYLNDPVAMEKIYEAVIDSLSLQERLVKEE